MLTVNRGKVSDIRSFRDLKCWKACVELRKLIRPLYQKFPSEEKYRLTDQLIRATRSTTNNIAEGYGRYGYQENIQFCRQSRGSMTEIQDHMAIALEEKYITEPEYELVEKQVQVCLNLINGYINYLRRSKNEED